MTTTIAMTDLLEQAGARSRGTRHDCPKCGGFRTLTHSAEAFYCHRCQWRGNTITLQKDLGIYRRIPAAEYRELCRKRERAAEASRRLYAVVHSRQLELRQSLCELGRLEALAHEAGPREAAWESLAVVYRERPGIEAQLDALESASLNDLVHFLQSASPP